MSDRRDHQTRAATFQRVLAQLRRGGVEIDQLQDDRLSPAAVRRIVQRLALRGLAKVTDGRWVPQPVLLKDYSDSDGIAA